MCILVITRLPAISVMVINVDDGPFFFSGLTLFSLREFLERKGLTGMNLSLRSGTD